MKKKKSRNYNEMGHLIAYSEVEHTGSFAEWLIMLGKRIKLEMDIGQRTDLAIRNDVARALTKVLPTFNKITQEYEEMEKKRRGNQGSELESGGGLTYALAMEDLLSVP